MASPRQNDHLLLEQARRVFRRVMAFFFLREKQHLVVRFGLCSPLSTTTKETLPVKLTRNDPPC